MPDKKIMLTYEGLTKMEMELHELKTVKRKEVAEKIKEARGQGDLSENAEYDAAKDEQAEIEARIVKLEKMLRNAVIIDETLGNETINVGSKVRLLDVQYNEEVIYNIVGSAEANPAIMKLSNESPVGKALLGHELGDTISVDVPEGTIEFKVLEIIAD